MKSTYIHIKPWAGDLDLIKAFSSGKRKPRQLFRSIRTGKRILFTVFQRFECWNENTKPHQCHKDGSALKRFDYIVSNPPFKMDFSNFRDALDSKENQQRFFAGMPKVPKAAKDKMAIYQLFLQHIIFSLKPGGKAAVVVPTGFITAQSGIDKSIRKHLVKNKMLAGVVSMPSNIFATTGTNVSILFINASNKEKVVLIDASNLGEKVKDGKNQKTVLTEEEERRICEVFNNKWSEQDVE